MASAKTTTDHEEIRKWAEARGGKPTCVKRTGSRADDPGIIRINFPGYSGEGSLEEIGWEEWFQKFDSNGLALLYQEETRTGEPSNFNKLVSREKAERRTAGNRGEEAKTPAAKAGSTKQKAASGKESGRKKAA